VAISVAIVTLMLVPTALPCVYWQKQYRKANYDAVKNSPNHVAQKIFWALVWCNCFTAENA
jgi:hypothetical protein